MSTPVDRRGTDGERDWNKEFEELTAGLTWDEPDDVPAARSTFPDAEIASPAGVGESPESSAAPEASTSHREPTVDGSPGVPGFNPQWRASEMSVVDAGGLGGAPELAGIHTGGISDEDDVEFIPPEPEPIDTSDPHTVIMIVALVVGPLWLLYLLFFDRHAATLWWIAACGIALGGFAMAVLRQPQSRDEDDTDDGARL